MILSDLVFVLVNIYKVFVFRRGLRFTHNSQMAIEAVEALEDIFSGI